MNTAARQATETTTTIMLHPNEPEARLEEEDATTTMTTTALHTMVRLVLVLRPVTLPGVVVAAIEGAARTETTTPNIPALAPHLVVPVVDGVGAASANLSDANLAWKTYSEV